MSQILNADDASVCRKEASLRGPGTARLGGAQRRSDTRPILVKSRRVLLFLGEIGKARCSSEPICPQAGHRAKRRSKARRYGGGTGATRRQEPSMARTHPLTAARSDGTWLGSVEGSVGSEAHAARENAAGWRAAGRLRWYKPCPGSKSSCFGRGSELGRAAAWWHLERN